MVLHLIFLIQTPNGDFLFVFQIQITKERPNKKIRNFRFEQMFDSLFIVNGLQIIDQLILRKKLLNLN